MYLAILQKSIITWSLRDKGKSIAQETSSLTHIVGETGANVAPFFLGVIVAPYNGKSSSVGY